MPPTPSPSRTSIVLVLIAAAVIGFLAGALAAVTRQSPQAGPDPTAAATATPSSSPTATESPNPSIPVDSEISLTADRANADTDELIRLEGVLSPATGGVRLQVQQSVDGIGFADFPVTATTRADGSFGIWVRTGRTGTNEFRMATDVDGQQVASNAVTVQIS